MDLPSFRRAVYDLIATAVDPIAGLTAANLGLLIKTRIGADWIVFGYPKLKDLLSDLEREGLIRVGQNEKSALSVWLPASQPPDRLQPAGQLAVGEARRPSIFRPLRKHVWAAFIISDPSNAKRFLNRQTGFVWSSPNGLPGNPNDWVQIEEIGQSEQRSWARDFLVEHAHDKDEALKALIDCPDWYKAFPAALATRGQRLATEWNRRRSQLVQQHVAKWCKKTGVSSDLVFDPPKAQLASKTWDADGTSGLRVALLDAVARMATEELLLIPIPAKYLVEVLRPDLAGTSSH